MSSESEKGGSLEKALALAAQGFAVFPLKHNEKVPLVGSHGFKDASLNPVKIRALWRNEPKANIGISAWDGENKLVIFDFEGQGKGNDLKASVAAWHEKTGLRLRDSFVVRTPSDGLHAYFNVPADSHVSSTTNYVPGCDIRAAGGYVVAPGSTVDGKEYTVHHDRAPGFFEPFDFGPKVRSAEPGGEAGPHDLKRAARWLEDREPAIEGEGGDDWTYRTACTVRDFGVSEEQCLELLKEHWNERCDPPWEDDDLGAKVRHAYSYAQKEAGTEHTDPNAAFGDLVVPDEPAQPGRFHPWPLSVLDDRPPPRWTVRKIVPEQGIGLLVGPYSQYKSFVAVDLASSVVTGEPWAGEQIKRSGPVVYVAGEGAIGIIYRFRAWFNRMDRGLPDDLFIVERMPNFGEPDQVREFAEGLQAISPGLVVLDTLATAMLGANENSSEDMGRFLQGASYLQRSLRSFVLVVHHMGKDAERGSRGWTGLPGASDLEIQVRGHQDKRQAHVRVSKSRDAEGWAKARVFSGEAVNLGEDAEGDKIETLAFRYNPNVQADADKHSDQLQWHALEEIMGETEKGLTRRALAAEMVDRVFVDLDDEMVDNAVSETMKWLAKHAVHYQVEGTTFYAAPKS